MKNMVEDCSGVGLCWVFSHAVAQDSGRSLRSSGRDLWWGTWTQETWFGELMVRKRASSMEVGKDMSRHMTLLGVSRWHRRCYGLSYIVHSMVEPMCHSPSFSILINGELQGYFPGQRGLKQGDLFPATYFLFLWKLSPPLCNCTLKTWGSVFIQCVHNSGSLIFADDMFVVCKTDQRSFIVVV